MKLEVYETDPRFQTGDPNERVIGLSPTLEGSPPGLQISLWMTHAEADYLAAKLNAILQDRDIRKHGFPPYVGADEPDFDLQRKGQKEDARL